MRGVLGASDIGVSANGPLGKKTTYQVSVRRSYLQFLFDMIGLPFLPTFTDAQFKIKHSFNPKNELTVLGLGAIDDMKLNTGMEDMSEKNQYILSYLPVVKQKRIPLERFINTTPVKISTRSLSAVVRPTIRILNTKTMTKARKRISP